MPVVHRGAIHAPAPIAVLVGGTLVLGAPRQTAAAFGTGVPSHLVPDTLTSAGVTWLYPASTVHASLDRSAHGVPGTIVLRLASRSFASGRESDDSNSGTVHDAR